MNAKKTNRKIAHTPKSPKGMGDYYGTGVKAPIGKMRDGLGMQVVSKSKLKKPPRSLA
jgi:hypothetical protein